MFTFVYRPMAMLDGIKPFLYFQSVSNGLFLIFLINILKGYPKAKNNEKKQNDDFASKIYLLDQLISSVNDEDWYNNQYEEYYENRKKAIAKAKLTRAKNKADTLNQRV